MSDGLAAAKDRVVRFHYALRDSAGAVKEDSRSGEPAAALIGHRNLMPGLEAALMGRSAGERFEVTLDAEHAFGARRPDWVQRVPKKHLHNPGRLKPGMETQLNTDQGSRTVTVVKVGNKVVDVDLNHPLAGETVTFDIEVVDVREATREEITHRHVHGAGGHHH